MYHNHVDITYHIDIIICMKVTHECIKVIVYHIDKTPNIYNKLILDN